MRIVTALVCLSIAAPVSAAEYDLNAKVTKAVIFGTGANVTREAQIALPVGQHRLMIPVRESTPVISFEGTGAVQVRALNQGNSKLLVAEDSDALKALQATFQTARQNMRAYQEKVEAATARQAAAELRLDFLRALVAGKGKRGQNTNALDAAGLQGVVDMLDTTAVDAFTAITTAKTALANLQQQEKGIRLALTRAQEALKNATPPELRVREMVVEVTVTAAFDGKVISSGLTQDSIWWRPAYELNLQQTGDIGELEIKQRAVVSFDSTESWHNVALVLSTAPLSSETRIWPPRSQLYGLQDPEILNRLRRKVSAYSSSDQGAYAPEPVLEAMAVEPGPRFLGQTLVFSLGGDNDLFWNDRNKQFALNSFTVPVGLYGLAVASTDAQAFLYTDFTNDTGGVILSGEALLYRDGALVGEMEMPQLNPGVEVPLGLGPLLGMQVAQNILNAKDGESGFISSSSEKSREVETVVTSTLEYPIWVKLLDVLPTSENEALEITMRATPRPNEDRYQGQRGVLAWDLDMQAGAERTVKFSYKMKWPKDDILLRQ